MQINGTFLIWGLKSKAILDYSRKGKTPETKAKMAECLSEQKTDEQEPIYPEIKQGIFCGVCLYQQVVKLRKGTKDKYR